MIPYRIEEGRPEDVLDILSQVPEFDHLRDAQAISSRLKHVPHLILIAISGQQVIGFKIGYERDQNFYSWLGAIHPDHRRQGVAESLADTQEVWAKKRGYTKIWMKTRNRFPQMLMMALNRGFHIIRIDPSDTIPEHRIILEKSL